MKLSTKKYSRIRIKEFLQTSWTTSRFICILPPVAKNGSGSVHRETFRKGSRTYFNSTRFFPAAVRDDVFVLYGFVRVADNFVDQVPQDRSGFEAFVERYRGALAGTPSGDLIVDSFVDLAGRREFDPSWTEAFLASMRMDLEKPVHATLPETLEYVYGSAEVIGLFMARLLGLDRSAERAACMLGRAMQFINFIRDIDEDNQLGRTYLPIAETSLPDLREETVRADPEEFERFVRAQLDRYNLWQAEAEVGYAMIPRRYRIPIKTAGDMYNWTGRVISRDPWTVFRRKVKPSRGRIVATGLINLISC